MCCGVYVYACLYVLWYICACMCVYMLCVCVHVVGCVCVCTCCGIRMCVILGGSNEFPLLVKTSLTVYIQALLESQRSFSRPLISWDLFFKKIVFPALRTQANTLPSRMWRFHKCIPEPGAVD